MTDAQFEAASRRFCKLQGVDPDESIPHGADPDPRTGFVPAILLYSPAWMLQAKEIKRIYHAILAIEQALDEDSGLGLHADAPCIRKNPENTDKI